MCQNLFSLIGLCLDISGFLLIAFEWRHVFSHEYRKRLYELEQDSERTHAEQQGKSYKDPRRADYTMWRDMQRYFVKDWELRRAIFYFGVILVVLGFLGQFLGNWPGGIFGLKTC